MTVGKTPRIAVIGCGYWGANHVRTLAELGALHAIADRHEARAQALADEHGATAMTAEAVFADPEIDGVALALPAHVHPDFALRAIEGGKHVFVEKPIALSSELARSVVDAAKTKRRVLMAGHILRYHTAFMAVMDMLQKGVVGTISHVQSHRFAFGKFHTHFDALWDLGPHDLSLVLAVAGRAPDQVQGIPVSMTGSVTDAAHVHMKFADQMTAHIHVSRHSAHRERRFSVIGNKGTIVWDDFADWPQKVAFHRHRLWQEGGKTAFELAEPDYVDVQPGMALTDELSHFLDCIESGQTPLTDGAQAMEIISILERAS